jgi:hypothetical protein
MVAVVDDPRDPGSTLYEGVEDTELDGGVVRLLFYDGTTEEIVGQTSGMDVRVYELKRRFQTT